MRIAGQRGVTCAGKGAASYPQAMKSYDVLAGEGTVCLRFPLGADAWSGAAGSRADCATGSNARTGVSGAPSADSYGGGAGQRATGPPGQVKEPA